MSGSFIFGEWLLGSCQHTSIQEYVRLLNSWCEWNNCSRHFIAAVSLLENGQTHKSFDLFMQASKGVLSESFLRRITIPRDNYAEDITQNQAICLYYLKVIQLFQQHSALNYVIALAKSAIGILNTTDPQLVKICFMD